MSVTGEFQRLLRWRKTFFFCDYTHWRKGLGCFDGFPFSWPVLSVKVKVNGYLHPHTHIYRGVMMWLFFLSNWGYGKGFEGGINNNHVYRLAHSILFLIVIWFCLLFVRCHFVELLLLFFFECVCVMCAAVAIFIVLAAIKVSIFFVPLNRMVLWSLGIDAKKGTALHRQANLTACCKSVRKLLRMWIVCYLWE